MDKNTFPKKITNKFTHLFKVEQSGLCSITLVASCRSAQQIRDSDDVKLLIDDKIKKNNLSVFHRDWFWSANILTALFGGRKKKTFEENLPKGIHYLDFWADRAPTLHEVVLDLGIDEIKRVPTVWNPKWTGNFDDDTEQIIMARMILGEGENQNNEAKITIARTVLAISRERWKYLSTPLRLGSKHPRSGE